MPYIPYLPYIPNIPYISYHTYHTIHAIPDRPYTPCIPSYQTYHTQHTYIPRLPSMQYQPWWSRKQFGIEMAELKLDRCMYSYNLLGSLHEKTKKNLRKPKKTKKNIFRLFWGHSMKKPKKPWENQTKKKQKKQYLETISRAPPQRLAKYCFFFVWFSQGFFGFFMEWPQKSLKIFFFVFFGFLKFFWFFHGVTPEESVNFVSMGPSPKCLKILYCYDYIRRRQKWNTKNTHFML